MNYQESLEFIEKSHKFGMRLGLENSFKLLELLGNPQDKLKFVHVAGTNGKGSTCSFISNTLKEQGYKVGLYTSPYLETFTERIRLNGHNIPEDDVARIITIMKEKIELMVSEGFAYPTEFEIETAMAFYYYCEQKADYVVLEVGLGGRYDATNVIKTPLASVIVSISLDHIGILGDTLGKIAYEKAGIIKEDSIAVVYKQKPEAEEVIKNVCKEKNTKYIEADFKNLEIKKSDVNSQVFDCTILGEKFEDMEISLIGEHQVNNAVLALTVIKVLRDEKHIEIEEESIRKAFLNTRWPGRIEKIKDNPTFIIDGAHNEDGAISLSKALEKHFKGKRMTLLIGMLKDKDIDGVLEILMDKFDKVITTTPDSDRAISCDELKEKIEKYIDDVTAIPNIEEAVKYTLERDTLGKIAYEKAGIIKEDSIAVVYKQKPEAEEVIKNVCKEKNTKYIEADFKNLEIKKSDVNSQVFDCTILGEKFEDMEISLIGEHQVNNAVLALTVIKVLRDEKHIEIEEESIRKAFLNTRWPGRIEKIKDNPTFIIDGAHNEDGAISLSKALEKHFKGKRMTLLIGMLKDKDIDGVLEILMDKFDKVITTTPDSDRAISCDELKEKIEKYIDDVTAIPNIEEAVKYTLENASENDVIISAGSLYMIGHVRQLVK